MKTFLITLSFCLFLFFSSCSEHESLISSSSTGNEMAKLNLAKENSLSGIGEKDTIIVLPNSGKFLIINKDNPKDKLELLDKYLAKHKKIRTVEDIIEPKALPCGLHIEKYWVMQNQFKSKPGKYLGMWGTIGFPIVYQHGFNNICIGGHDARDDVMSVGFHDDSIMVCLKGYDPSYINLPNPAYKYYYVDDAYGSSVITINTYSSYIYQRGWGGKLLLSDYHWPYFYLGCPSDDYSDMMNYMINSNTYIMCDKYETCGWNTVKDYWEKYKAVYGIPVKNLTNWITLNYSLYDDGKSAWPTLLNLANAWGMNPIWVEGWYQTVETLDDFCGFAFSSGWLSALCGQLVTKWRCDAQPCETSCTWPNGSWYISRVYYQYYQWF